MIKQIFFLESNKTGLGKLMTEKGAVKAEFPYYQDPKGFAVSCFELTPDQITQIIGTRKIWVVQPTEKNKYIPLTIQLDRPFKYGNEENKNPNGTSDNKQPDERDH